MQLQVDAPPQFATVRKQFESIPPQQFDRIAQLVGLPDSGSPVHVVLAAEGSEWAAGVPQWIAGYAIDEAIVVFPDRSPRYPDNTLDDVIRHEFAHVMIRRAAAGYPVPRWFNEGLAMSAERDRGLRDETQFLYQIAAGSPVTLNQLDRLFAGTQNDQTRAYAVAGAVVHDVSRRHGRTIAAAILAAIARGQSFDAAFLTATGTTPATADAEFWQRQRVWTSWLPLFTSSTTLWMLITVLALLAIYRRQRRNREIERRWEEEDPEQR
jgi:hypothetical protein